MATRIQVRRDTATSWTTANPTLASGELGLVTDSGKVVACKVGDGSAAWTALEYAIPMMQGVPNINRATDTGDTTFLLKGLGSQASVFAIEEAGAGTDKILNISDVGLITLTDGAGATKVLVTSASGDIAVNTNKLTVAGATGNTTIAGTLTTVNTSIVKGSGKFLKVQTAGGADKFTVATDTGATVIAGDITANGNITGDDACTLYAPADVAKADGGGSIVQVQYTQIEEPQSETVAGQTDVALDWFAVTITPKSANSVIKIDVDWNGKAFAYPYRVGLLLQRAISGGATSFLKSTGTVGNRTAVIKVLSVGTHQAGGSTTIFDTCNFTYWDSTHGATSAITYKVAVNHNYTTGTKIFMSNRDYNDTDAVDNMRAMCWISATEIAAKA
tara:strand:+ start:1519 stop:2685 length:1167 start_codon:yes stop_codon:yes gene_type:complete